MPSVVFVCVANSFRSQMAEAVARSLASSEWEIWSAGSNPSGQVHPLAKQLMAERGMDLSAHRSKGIEALPVQRWDYVVTMGCGDRCPTLQGVQRFDWDIPDPAGLPLKEARRVRDDIEQRVRALLASHHTGGVT
jgi:protein-tyrosine-phosphatase